MNDEEYPNEIDLGRKVKDYGACVPCVSDVAEDEDEEKTKIVYPSLYISGVPALLDLPEEGCCMVKYRRIGMEERERNGEKTVSVELEILKICHADDEETENDEIAKGIQELLAKAQGGT
jgi:hypothetical protein